MICDSLCLPVKKLWPQLSQDWWKRMEAKKIMVGFWQMRATSQHHLFRISSDGDFIDSMNPLSCTTNKCGSYTKRLISQRRRFIEKNYPSARFEPWSLGYKAGGLPMYHLASLFLFIHKSKGLVLIADVEAIHWKEFFIKVQGGIHKWYNASREEGVSTFVTLCIRVWVKQVVYGKYISTIKYINDN